MYVFVAMDAMVSAVWRLASLLAASRDDRRRRAMGYHRLIAILMHVVWHVVYVWSVEVTTRWTVHLVVTERKAKGNGHLRSEY